MAYFPMFIDIKGKKCSIAGGGKVAFRKAKSLLQFEAEVEVTAPDVCPEFESLRQQIAFQKKKAEPADFKNSFLVIAATDDRNVNHEISSYCKEQGIFVNVIDSQEECSFIFPATVKREDISIGITTSGSSPVLSSTIRKAVEQAVPEYYGRLSRTLRMWRKRVKEEIPSEDARKKAMKRLTQLGIQKQGQVPKEEAEEVLHSMRKETEN